MLIIWLNKMLSKAKQLSKNGKMRKKSVKDVKYLSDLHSIGLSCIVCGSNRIELHHVYSVLHGVERSDHRVIPLCVGCHRTNNYSAHGKYKAKY